MIANFGFGALVICFLISLFGIGASLYGYWRNSLAWADSACVAVQVTSLLLAIATGCLVYLLATGHFEVRYVYTVTGHAMPLYQRVMALWGGQAGSLLFWCWLLSISGLFAVSRNWSQDREFQPWVIAVILITLSFFLGLLIFNDNPYVRFWQIGSGMQTASMVRPAGGALLLPPDGLGLNTMLRHPAMIFHPPLIYLGFVFSVIPFAFVIAALITGRLDDCWIRISRSWALVAWLFLSLGILLGSRWAYEVLGWGGYWNWDPVEIAALLPWLSGTAFLHSVMIQEKRGLFIRWNLILIFITYSLVIFGTFLTRTGVLSSVHAFAQSSIGPIYLIFISIVFILSISLVLYRWNGLKSYGQVDSLLSREALFLLNNILFISILVICLFGLIFPVAVESLTGYRMTIGSSFYRRATGPLFAALVLLMGIAPLSAWGYSTIKTYRHVLWIPAAVASVFSLVFYLSGLRNGIALAAVFTIVLVICITLYNYGRGVFARMRRSEENFLVSLWRLTGKNRRRYGGYIIHIGVSLIALGIVGIEMFHEETQGMLKIGETLSLGGYAVTYNSLDQFDTVDGRNITRAVVDISRDGQSLGQLYPRSDFYFSNRQSMTIPGIHSNLADDLYVLLVDWQPVSTESATFMVYYNPLANWLWIGGLVFILGALVAAWPGRQEIPASNRPVKSVIEP